MGVIQRHKGELLFHLVQSFNRRNKRTGTGGDHQLVVINRFAAVQRNGFCFGINCGNGLPQHGLDAIISVKGVGTVFHPFLISFPVQQVGDQRTGIGVVGFRRNQGNGGFTVDLPDTFDTSDCCGRVADNHIFHTKFNPFSESEKVRGGYRSS